MEPFVRLTSEHAELLPETRILKARDYLVFQDAERLLAEARRQAEEICNRADEAYAEQKARGYEEGISAAKLEMAEHMLETVGQTVDYFSQVEKQVAGVVMAAVRKILGEFDNEELSLRVARNALVVVRNQKQVKLRVCPEQVENLRKRLAEIHAGYTEIGYMEVIADHRLAAGGCILETDIGAVDASVEIQLQALEKALKSRIGSPARQGS